MAQVLLHSCLQTNGNIIEYCLKVVWVSQRLCALHRFCILAILVQERSNFARRIAAYVWSSLKLMIVSSQIEGIW